MFIVKRDEIGTVCVEVDSPISFLDGKVYFTTTDGVDIIEDVNAIVEIGG